MRSRSCHDVLLSWLPDTADFLLEVLKERFLDGVTASQAGMVAACVDSVLL